MRRYILSLALWFGMSGSGWAAGGQASNLDGPRTRLIVGFQPEVSVQRRAQLIQTVGMQVADQIDEIDVMVVEARGGFRPASVRLQAIQGVAEVEEDLYLNWLEGTDLPSRTEIPLGFGKLEKLMGAVRQQVPPSPKEGEIPWGIQRVNAPAAWNKLDPKTQGGGIRVAVIDTGIDCDHPDLSCSYSEGVNYVDRNKPPKDDHKHGTHVAGTIAARWNGKGVVGVAPLARVVPVKVLNKDGMGYMSSILKGMVWCGRRDIQVANMSFGAPVGMPFMRTAIWYSHRNGVTFVAAAGNSGKALGCPGCYPKVIAVSALDPRDGIADFSSRGSNLKFIAPGVNIISTVPGGEYAMFRGTSMASPHVAGLAAIAVAQGAKGPDQVLEALRNASSKVEGLSGKEKIEKVNLQGFGVVDAPRLVRRK